MVDKDTTEFSRESFKEKILRQLEENATQQSREELGSNESYFERPKSDFRTLNPKESSSTFEKRKVEFEPYNLPAFDFPKDDDDWEEESGEKTTVSQETGSLREKLEAFALEETQEQSDYSQFSRSQNRYQKESDEEEVISKPKQTNRPPKRKPSKKKKRGAKKKKKVTAGRIIAVIVLLLILAAAGTGWYGYNFIKAGVQPLDSKNHVVKAVNIPEGASSKQIGDILQKQSIIKNGMIFQYYTKFKNYTDFKSGYYNLSPDMELSAIASKLEEGGTPKPVAPTLGKVTIPEGYTLEQISKGITVNADSKDGKTPFSTADFMKTVQDPAFIAKMVKAYPKLFASLPDKSSGVKYQLEGYLFPATYEYTKSSTVETMIESMISAMNTQLTPYYGTIATQGMTVNETLSLAALVEKEANNDDDRRQVAGTFYNRMNQGMTLDSNSSVLYAQGQLGAKTTLKQDATIDTNLDSPFNLYANQGTGPGPIDSPSLSSIKAVLQPAQNDYLYFVADVTTGKVYFAKTLEEQNANVQTYVNDKLK
ncbi:MAG: endolytic transglycosylase MltG [Streptococcaceae bacterium]|nr:endolytic transglycosylase MltG [Streptococcaceae bacterium]